MIIFHGILFSSGPIPVFGSFGTGVIMVVVGSTVVVVVGSTVVVVVGGTVVIVVVVGGTVVIVVVVGGTVAIIIVVVVVVGGGTVVAKDETVLASSVTWVCASALPFNTAPVCMIICFALNIVPLNVEYVPRVAPIGPPTCQKTFEAKAPPESNTLIPEGTLPAEAILRSPAIWKTQTSFAPPKRVTLVGIVTLLLHL